MYIARTMCINGYKRTINKILFINEIRSSKTFPRLLFNFFLLLEEDDIPLHSQSLQYPTKRCHKRIKCFTVSYKLSFAKVSSSIQSKKIFNSANKGKESIFNTKKGICRQACETEFLHSKILYFFCDDSILLILFNMQENKRMEPHSSKSETVCEKKKGRQIFFIRIS